MASIPTPELENAGSTNSVSRIFGVIFSPQATFESIIKRPTWILPLISIILVSLAVIYVFGHRVGWRSFMDRQNQANARLQKQMESMKPEQREDMLETQTKFASIFGYVGVIIATPIAAAVVAAIFMGVFNLLGGKVPFVTSLSIVSYAWVPGIIGGLVGILVIFLKDPSTVDIQHLVAANAGAFLSEDAPKWLDTLLSSIDLFAFWNMILMAFGYSATNPKKISFTKAFIAVTSVWLIYVLVKVGFAAAFS
jgi:uncharacterized membrane protein YkgB